VGTAQAAPDGVGVTLTVRHRAEDAEGALAEAARKAEGLEALLRELGIGPERWITARLGLDEWTEWDERRRQELRRGYVASNALSVALPDTALLGRLLGQAVARTEAAVEGPRWIVDGENPAHDIARRRALRDARRRAEAYAAEAGLSLGGLREVDEVGSQPGRPHIRAPLHYAGAAVQLSGGPDMPVHGEGLEVVAAVEVTYLLEQA
jgi:uncharacterized protein YggE